MFCPAANLVAPCTDNNTTNALAEPSSGRVDGQQEVSFQKDQEHELGLLDSGASEVVRPYVYMWHQSIQMGKCSGKEVPVCLAGGVLKKGACF